MSSKINQLISVENLCKEFAIYDDPSLRLKQMIVPKLQKIFNLNESKYYNEFNALSDISFTVDKGECVGILGRNGAGKSTLLQIICGTLNQTSGSVTTRGNIAGLLELGSGFNPEYSGKENIYLNASILGLSRVEINHQLDEIINFANIGEFINYPVKLYSSGMYVRLAFAIAINVNPDILIIDEALAVGDENFQRKCYSKIEAIKKKGTTILFVSHSTQSIVEICDRAILIESGKLIAEGNPSKIVKYYQKLSSSSNDETSLREVKENIAKSIETDIEKLVSKENINNIAENLSIKDDSWYDSTFASNESIKYEQNDAIISNIHIKNNNGKIVNYLRKGFTYYICYNVRFDKTLYQVGFGMLIKTTKGIEIGGASNFNIKNKRIEKVNANDEFEVQMKFNCNFLPGTFFYNVGILSIQNEIEHYANRILDAGVFRVMEEKNTLSTSLVDLNVDILFKKIL